MPYKKERAVSEHQHRFDRRTFLKLGLTAGIGTCFPTMAWAAIDGVVTPTKTLSFHHTHTGERLSVCYCFRGRYQPDALNRINYLLRDHRVGEVKPIAPVLLDLLHNLSLELRNDPTFHVISGYRSPRTNAMLRKYGNGVARKSLHMQGKAIDIRVPGTSLKTLQRAAIALKSGGVGYYPKSDFIHVDIGRVRTW